MGSSPDAARGPQPNHAGRSSADSSGLIKAIEPVSSSLSETGTPLGLRAGVPLGRRTFLRGAGTALALPWLEAMLPKTAHAGAALASVGTGAAEGKSPVRMAFLFVPNGVIGDAWTPQDDRDKHTLSPTLEPLAPLKSEFLVLSGLSQRNARPLGDGGGDHAARRPRF